ncbi:MAG: hypothetical protein KGH65_05500 [Candidatus Micrarchaeota archaeon]|nr:hypothetical protein [Candidatus Micrarchaeota archaeon]
MDIKALGREPDAQFMCAYCGHSVPSYNPNFGICPFCEQYAEQLESDLKRNKEAFAALTEISTNTTTQKYDDALDSFDRLIAIAKTPQNLYAKAIFHLYLSDYEYGKRDYQTPNGFMEENSNRIDAGNLHFSNAKALFFQAITLADKQMQGNPDPLLNYTKFLSQMQLRRMLDTKKTLAAINAISQEAPITKYANMLYYCMNNDKRADTYISKVTEIGIPNGFYYYASFLAEKKNLGEAKKILLKLLEKVDIHSAKKLLIGIERVQTIL